MEIYIDEWPWLKPLVEIEGRDEASVKNMCQKLGLDYREAIFDSTNVIYSQEYKVSREIKNNKIPRVTFNTQNSFSTK